MRYYQIGNRVLPIDKVKAIQHEGFVEPPSLLLVVQDVLKNNGLRLLVKKNKKHYCNLVQIPEPLKSYGYSYVLTHILLFGEQFHNLQNKSLMNHGRHKRCNNN